MIVLLKNRIHQIAPELQFWGYEGGNLLAAIAGAGGFVAFYNGLRSVGEMRTQNFSTDVAAAFTGYPDILVTLGLATVVLATIAFGKLFSGAGSVNTKAWIDKIASVVGIFLVGAALYFGASWITFTAVSFVSASALLRLCRTSAVFLKLGGLMLAAGGFGLVGFGLSSTADSHSATLPALTALTGVYVVFASLMTYQGGIYECISFQKSTVLGGAHGGLFHPNGRIGRFLESNMDRPVSALVTVVALPSVFWVPLETKTTAPFLTSMWTRLPWRLLTAGAALATGTTVGMLFGIANVFWAIGDIAIGSLDWNVTPG